ncbi:hypothetical protein SKAU_G00291160 [Synaphobranchus kaupii]|uniref:Anti-proliferative protein domain-containing protein n=1 Tax=Synaphobranchus kaupii TaxID=118154 RepID=A0A9Q1IMA8_SYNKA|nr:hypothetical protein SKAU_G00291160 [Synaphobranchus kaupii]
MQLEIQVALNFIISYLYNKLPRRRVNIFGEELERQLRQKYEGHWYPEKPYKGSGYRCIHVGEKVDPVVEQAARESGLEIQDVRNNLPQDLSVWIDPFEVSYQIGDKGPVKVLYVDDTAVSPSFPPRPAPPLTFTTASFAATKFGSTKMKSSGRGAAKGSRSSPTGIKAPATSLPPLYGPPPQGSALSPNAKEFVFPNMQGRGQGSDGPLPYSNTFDVFAAYGGLNDKSLMDGLSLSLNNMQYSNQQFQPVMAN